MTSGRLVRRVLCKKETNQKVKALREELELKKKDIEEKGTKLNTLLQYPFGVIKLLATNYFNLRRRIEEPSNVRTRQTQQQATVAVAAVSEKNSSDSDSDSDRDVIEGLMEKIEKIIDSLFKAKTVADKAEEVAKKVEEVAKKSEEVAALQAAALQAAAAVEELETEELEAQAEAAKVAAEQAKAQVEAVALQAKAALQAAENGDLTELEAEELEAQAAAAALQAEAALQAAIAIVEAKKTAEKIAAQVAAAGGSAEIAEQVAAAKVAAEQAKAQVVALQAKESELSAIEIFMSENYGINIAGCYKSILDILGNLSKQNIKNKLKEFIHCCYNNYVVGVDADEDEFNTDTSGDTITFTSNGVTDTLTRKMMNPYYDAPYKKVIINGFINIGNGAFRDWFTNLEEVVIGNSVVNIGEEVFYRCYELTKIVIGNSLEKIGKFTCSYCYKISPVVISDETAKQLNPEWTSPGTVSSFYGSSNPVEFITPVEE